MLEGARRHAPNAELVGVCSDPRDTTHRHHVPALPIAIEPDILPHLLRRLGRPLWEVGDWLRVLHTVRSLDMLVMTGTGMITDANEGLFGVPYQMFKWVVLARVARRKVKFVSVGAEKLDDPIKLFFLASSLRLAEYRSYRDEVTRKRAAGLLDAAKGDPLYPDLAFSLPEALTRDRPSPSVGRRTVAVGIYAVEASEEAVGEYIEAIGGFILWLLDQGYRTRIVLGDRQYDVAVLAKLRTWLAARQALDRVIDEPVNSFEELLNQLAEADLVVATRFHNVLLSLLLGKPVVSLSHMDKNDQLMTTLGLSAYCRALEGTTEQEIVALFRLLEQNAEPIRSALRQKLELFRSELEEQYRIVFGGFGHSHPPEAS